MKSVHCGGDNPVLSEMLASIYLRACLQDLLLAIKSLAYWVISFDGDEVGYIPKIKRVRHSGHDRRVDNTLSIYFVGVPPQLPQTMAELGSGGLGGNELFQMCGFFSLKWT